MRCSFFTLLLAYASTTTLYCDSEEQYSFYSKLETESRLPAKSCAEIYQINKASRLKSGYYWISTPSVRQVYCDMELECGGIKGGWTRVAYLDPNSGYACPSGWSRIAIPGTSTYVCRSGDAGGCYSAYYSTHYLNFNKICGRAVAYQKGSPDAFHATSLGTKSINDIYVDGISITVGNPRKHVWTYAAGLSDDYNYPKWNCPCAHYPGPDPPAFVEILELMNLLLIIVLMYCGMDMVVLVVKTTVVQTQACLGSSVNLLGTCMVIILR